MVTQTFHVVVTCEGRKITVPLSKLFDRRVCTTRDVDVVSVL